VCAGGAEMKNFFVTLATMDFQKVLMAAILVGSGYYFFLYDSGDAINKEVEDLRMQVIAEGKKKDDTDATLLEEKHMREEVGILTEKYQIISKKLPAQLSTFEVNGAIETYARETQVKIKGSKPGLAEKMEIVEEVPLDIVIEGKYPDLLQFIYNVSIAERLTKFKSLSILPVGGANQAFFSSNLRLEGVVVGYKLAPETDDKDKKGVKK
jgi:type IV pilus assembly protein PilO